MRWLLLFLAGCGSAFTTDPFATGEASAPPTDASKDSIQESSAKTSRTGITGSTDATATHGDSESMEAASLPDTSARPISDAGYGASNDARVFIDAGDCNLSCEPMCVRLMMPMHACCSPHEQCHCTTIDAGSACVF